MTDDDGFQRGDEIEFPATRVFVSPPCTRYHTQDVVVTVASKVRRALHVSNGASIARYLWIPDRNEVAKVGESQRQCSSQKHRRRLLRRA